MYNKNNSGLSTDPWGTPEITEEDLEDCLSQMTD